MKPLTICFTNQQYWNQVRHEKEHSMCCMICARIVMYLTSLASMNLSLIFVGIGLLNLAHMLLRLSPLKYWRGMKKRPQVLLKPSAYGQTGISRMPINAAEEF